MKNLLLNSLKIANQILHNNFTKNLDIKIKTNQSNIVTEVDIASEKAIVKNIKRIYPNHNIIAEETGYYWNNSSYTWIIDPLDGTSNYASGLPWYGAMIAILKDWNLILSGISLPEENKIYLAEKNKNAYLNDKKITVTEEKKLSNLLFSYCLDYTNESGKLEKDIQIMKAIVPLVRNLRATNSCYDICAVAEGKFGGYINQTCKIWDIAAGQLLLEEAGGVFVDIKGKKINYKVTPKNYARNFTFIATTNKLINKILSVIN